MDNALEDNIEGKPIPELWRDCYAQLKVLARSRLRIAGEFTLLDTTGLVHQSFLKLQELGTIRLDAVTRRQFFSYASGVMRSVIVDLARERLTQRRGSGGILHLEGPSMGEVAADEDDPLYVDNALAALRAREPRLAQVVEMRFFGGYSEAEIGELLDLTERTVRRDWDKARILMRMLLA
ncbi:MAG: ECF-type sigma factor [Panacagrimonas sp.]